MDRSRVLLLHTAGLVALLGVGSAATGCDPVAPGGRLGLVMRSGQVHVVTCGGDQVGYVKVRRQSTSGNGPFVWEARALGRATNDLAIAPTVPGYSVRGDARLARNGRYTISEVDDPAGNALATYSIDFLPSDLQADLVRLYSRPNPARYSTWVRHCHT